MTTSRPATSTGAASSEDEADGLATQPPRTHTPEATLRRLTALCEKLVDGDFLSPYAVTWIACREAKDSASPRYVLRVHGWTTSPDAPCTQTWRLSRTGAALLLAGCGLECPDPQRWPLPAGWYDARVRARTEWRAEFARNHEAVVLRRENEELHAQIAHCRHLAAACAAAQTRLDAALHDMAPSSRPAKRARTDGRSAYATCSSTHYENGNVEMRFLAAYDSDEENPLS